MATNTNIINQDSLLFRSKQRAELNYQNYLDEKQQTAEKYGFVTLSDKSYKAIQQGEQNIQATQGLVESLLADNDTLASLGIDNNSIAELSSLMQQAADPEAMKDDLITAVAFSQHLNISVSDAMQNLDNLLEAQFYTPVKRGKTAVKAINDSKMLGKLTLDRGIIGSKLKNAEVGSDEYNDLFSQLQAIDEEMIALQDWMPRPWYVALAKLGANSATYSLLSATAGGTGAAVGKALEIAVSMTPLKAALKVPMAIVTGAISAGARGSVAYTVESGNLYYDLVADGIDSEVAKGFSTIYGVAAAATEQVFDAAVSSVLRAFNIPVSNLSSMVVSRLLASGTLKNTASVFGAKALSNLFMEGAEEAATSLLEDGATALAYVFNNMLTTTQQKSLPKDFGQVLKDAWKEGLAGAGGSLFLGTAGAALETRMTMQQGIGIANAAKTIHSQQIFEKKAEQFKPEDIADTDWQDLLSKAWEQNAEARDRSWNASEFRAYAEADIYSGGVYDNSGKLYSAPEDLSALKNKDLFFQESITETENGTVHTLQFGNPDQIGVRASTIDILQRQKEDPTLITEQDIEELKNNDRFAMPSIGTVTFKTTNDGKLNILSSSMENGYEGLEKQAIKQVIDMYPDYDISWANTGSKQAIYDELVEENPRGQEAGLNYRERYDDADTAYVLRWLGNHFSQSDAENRVMAILLQHAAGRMGLSGEQFITKYSSDIREIGEEEAKMIRAMGKDPDSVKGFTLSLKEEARAVIYAGKKADVTTFQHELNHVLMGIGENKADFEKAFHQALSTDPERLSMFIEQNIDVIPSATKNGKYDPNFLSTLYNREEDDDRDWTRLEEEFEDQLWEAYHRKGDTLNPELKGFFRRIAESFRRIYKALRNANGIELNAELRDYFDRLYGFDKDGVDKGRDFSSWEYKRNMSLAQEEYDSVASLSPDDQYAYIRDKYVGTEEYMRAPNGKASNLTEKQWIMVRTPAFKEWFGDWENDPENASKVLDENGEPREVYHGSDNDFDVFDINMARANMDIQGLYFSSDMDESMGYGNNISKVFLNIRKPADSSISYSAFKSHRQENNAGIKAREDIEAQGYDGIISVDDEYTEYVAFDSNQIKSATDNSGAFSADNDSILFQGYDWNAGMSNNAVAAYENGEMPKSKWTKDAFYDAISSMASTEVADILNKIPVSVKKDYFITHTSWHHTGKYFNRTDFYSLKDAFEGMTVEEAQAIVDAYKSHPAKLAAYETAKENILSKDEFEATTLDGKYSTFLPKGYKHTKLAFFENLQKDQASQVETVLADMPANMAAFVRSIIEREYDPNNWNRYETSRSGNIYRLGEKPTSAEKPEGLERFSSDFGIARLQRVIDGEWKTVETYDISSSDWREISNAMEYPVGYSAWHNKELQDLKYPSMFDGTVLGRNNILFQDADYDGTVAITADVRKEFERDKEAIPAESNWHDVLFQLKSVTSNVQTSYKGRRDVTYAVSMQPEVYEKFRNKEWKEADFEIESFEQARFINTNEERLKDWQQLYADRMAAKWTVHKRNGTLETKNITFGRMKKNAKAGKVESIPCVDLSIGCQRIRTVIERIENGIMPADTPIESCYGGTCFVNLDQAHKLYGSENVDTKDLVMVTPDDIRRWFSFKTTREFLQKDTGFIRMGFRGDCAHSFPILDGYNTSLAETWLQCIKDYDIRNPKTGELMKTVFITAGYAPTTEESYARLVPFKDLCEIHVSTSGWFSKNELMLRLAEFDVMNKLGLNVSLRVVTDRNSISDSPFNNTNWLKDMIFNVMKIPQTQLLGTAYHNDRAMKHSQFDQDFVNQCCVTGKCKSCNVGCMVRNKNSATSKFLAPYGTEFVTEDSYLHKNETKPASFEFEAEEDVFEDNDYLETSRDDESLVAKKEQQTILMQSDEGDTKAEIKNGTLYISHSISDKNLRKTLQMGGFPMPSLAITKPSLSKKTAIYGDIVLIGGRDLARESIANGSVYDRDLWSPMYPDPEYAVDLESVASYINGLNDKYPQLNAEDVSAKTLEVIGVDNLDIAVSESIGKFPALAMEYLNETGLAANNFEDAKRIILADSDSYSAYTSWVRGKISDLYGEPYVTIDGERKPYTLQTILEKMQSQPISGNKIGLGLNTTGNLFSLRARQFIDREDMRKAEPALYSRHPDNAFRREMDKLAVALESNGFDFSSYDVALDAVREYLQADMDSKEKMADIMPGEMQLDDIIDAAYQLAEAFKTKEASYGFFEAKPGRIVALSEFKVAVVPESISADLYDALAANGLQIVMYNANDNYRAREKAIEELVEAQKDILFQESSQDLWLADIAELANTCTTYEQFRVVVDAFAMGEPTENAEADMRKAFDNRSTEEKKTTEPVFEESENIDFDFDWDSIKVEYYDYDPEPGYDIYDDETEDFIITSWSIAHEEEKTTIYKPNARHLSKDEKIDDFLTLLDDDTQLIAYLNALREANRIVKYGNERDLDFDPKAEADRYKRLMESADIIQQRIAPFIRNIVFGKAAKDGTLETGRIKGLSDKAKSIVRGIIEKNAAEYIDLFYRATGIDYWNVKAASESDIDAQAAKIAAEKGLSFAEERQIAVDIGDKIIEEKIIRGATVSNQEVRNLVRRNRDRAMLAEQEHQIAEQMLKDRLVVENGKIKQLTIEAQQAQEAISKVETALDEINEKINKAAARISKLANKKGVKDQDGQIVKLIQDKKALEQKKNYLERLKAQRTNYNLKLFHEGKMFSEAGLKKIAEIEAEIAKTIDKITELEKQQVISEDEAVDAIIRLTKGIEREKARKNLYNALTWERWKASKKLHEAKKKAEADILAQRMHDAVTYGKLYGRQIERLEKANLDLQVARKQERQARRLKAEMERLARQIMQKPSANVDLDEAEQIIQIQQALYPAFQSRMRVDGATYKVEDLRTLIKDPNSPILTLLSPDQLARLTKTSLDQMTLGELKAIAQAVKDLREKGLAKRRQYLIEQRQQAANIQYLLINQLMQSDRYKEPEVRGSLNESERVKKDRWNAIYLSTYNMARKAQMLDGNSKGAFYDLLIRRKRDRQDVQNRGIINRQAPVFAVLQEQGLELDDLYESIEVVIDGKPATFSLSQLAYVYLSINNEKNRAAVAYGNLITEAERLAIKKGVEARIIGGSEMADVRREAYNEELRIIGDRRYQELWEQAEEALNARPEKLAVFKAMEASLNSDRFDEVVALMRREFNEDIAREGYYLPINRSGIVGESPAEKLKADILNAVPGTRASVNKGMTMQRITISPHHQTSVDLDLVKAWGDSIYDQEHLLAFLEYTRLLDRIFENAFGENTRMLRETIESSYGPAMMREIDTYIKEVANPSAGKIADDMKRAGKLLKAMRGNMYAATFGFRISSIINQAITSPAPFLGAVRADEYARAAFRFMAHPNEMWAYVCERSSFMANRDMDVAQGIIRDAKESEGQSEFMKKYYRALEISMLGMQYTDRFTVAIGWLAIYDKEIQRLGEETPENVRQAVKKADEYVQETQPQSDVTELSPIVKSDSWSLIAPFQSALNTVWQNVTYDIPTAFKNGRYAEAIGTIVGYMIGGIMLALVHGELVPDEDDEKKGWSIARRIFNAGISQFVEGAPLMGDTISSILKMVITGEKDFYYGSNDIPLASSLVSVSTSVYDRKWLKALESLVYGTAQYFGAPVSEIKDIRRAFEEDDWRAIIGWRN